jgi:hypothetical protein
MLIGAGVVLVVGTVVCDIIVGLRVSARLVSVERRLGAIAALQAHQQQQIHTMRLLADRLCRRGSAAAEDNSSSGHENKH